MNLADELVRINQAEKLFSKEDRILIACSGGRDSIVLAHLFKTIGLTFGLVYIDHKTRSGDSLLDGLFVAKQAAIWNVPFFYHKIIFEKGQEKMNFQDYARKFRYSTFGDILINEHFTKLATAHHQQDSVESFFLNLSKKSGLSGLLGIEIKRNSLIRPMLLFSNEQINNWVRVHRLQFRTDLSNKDNKYQRNNFRNTVIPKLLEWDSNFIKAASQSMQYLAHADTWIENIAQAWRTDNVRIENSYEMLPLDKIKAYHSPRQLLHRLLQGMNFNMTQVDEILSSNHSGKKWQNGKFQIEIFRDNLYMYPVQNTNGVTSIEFPFESQGNIAAPYELIVHTIRPLHVQGELVEIPLMMKNNKLVLRGWQHGDYCQMSYGRKKVKKLLLENNIPSHERHATYVLAYEDQVLWIEKNYNIQKLISKQSFFIEILKK